MALVSLCVAKVAQQLNEFNSTALSLLPRELRQRILDFVIQNPLRRLASPQAYNNNNNKNLFFGPLLCLDSPLADQRIDVIDLSDYKDVTPKLLEHIADTAPNVKAILLRECMTLTDHLAALMIRLFPSTTTLTLSGGMKLTRKFFDQLKPSDTERFEKIVINTLRNCAESMQNFFNIIVNVRVLHLNCVGLSDWQLVVLANHCPLLVDLSLSNELELTDESLVALAKGECKQLARLKIGGRHITGEGLAALCDACPNMTHLDLDGCGISEPGPVFTISKFKKLQALSLLAIEFLLSGYLVERLIEHCNDLQSLRVQVASKPAGAIERFMATNNGLTNLQLCLKSPEGQVQETPMPMLEHILFSRGLVELNLTRVHPSALALIVSTLPSLQHLQLSYYTPPEDDEPLKVVLLESVSIICQDLKKLKLSDATYITPRGIECLAETAQHLTSVEITSSPTVVTDKFLEALASTAGDSIKSLKLYGSSQITDVGLGHIARYCSKRLHKLDVRLALDIGNEGLTSVAKHCHPPMIIHVSSSSKSILSLREPLNSI